MKQALSKFANAFIAGAEAEPIASAGTRDIMAALQKTMGGVWVGGRVILAPARLQFIPNALNVALHKPLPDIDIPLTDIKLTYRRFGWITGIVVIEHTHGEFRFRCYGAAAFAKRISARLDQAKTTR